LQLLTDEISELRQQFETDRKTKEVVQNVYEEVTATVKHKSEQHKATMADYRDRLEDGKRVAAEIKLKVRISVCCIV